jgi:hypothetical protein
LIILNIRFPRNLVGFIKHLVQLILIFLNLLFTNNALFQQLFLVDLINIWIAVDLLIHQRLGKQGLIQLIVSIFPVSDNINNHIFSELLSVLQTHPDDLVHHDWIIGVHVENGRHYRFSNFSAVETGAGVSLSGRETDLVVGYYVDYAAGSVALKVLELVGFVNNARIRKDTLGPRGLRLREALSRYSSSSVNPHQNLVKL